MYLPKNFAVIGLYFPLPPYIYSHGTPRMQDCFCPPFHQSLMLNTVISFFFDKYFTNWCGLLCWDFFKSTIEVKRIFIQGRLKIFPEAAPIRCSVLIIAVIPLFSNLEHHRITGISGLMPLLIIFR